MNAINVLITPTFKVCTAIHMYISPRKNGYPNVDFLVAIFQGDRLIVFGRCYYEDDSECHYI